jgi:hypothetical protein
MHNGSRAFCFLMALAATGTECASAATPASGVGAGHYRVEAKLVKVPIYEATEISTTGLNYYYSEKVLRHLSENQGASIVSFPVIDSYSKTFSSLDAKPVMLPDGSSRANGLWLSVVPDESGSYTLSFEGFRFNGFEDRNGNKPNFSVQRITQTVTPPVGGGQSGSICVNLPAVDEVPATYDADGRRMASIADANARQLLFVKITRG